MFSCPSSEKLLVRFGRASDRRNIFERKFLNLKQDQNHSLKYSTTQQQQGEPTQGTLPASIYASSKSPLFQGIADPAKRRGAMVKLSVTLTRSPTSKSYSKMAEEQNGSAGKIYIILPLLCFGCSVRIIANSF